MNQTKPGVVGHQRQTSSSLIVIPANPLVARSNVAGRRRPAQQRQPLALILDHVTQTLARQFRILEIVVLEDQLVPSFLFLRRHQPHDDLLQHRGFGPIRQCDLRFWHPNEQNKCRRPCSASTLSPSSRKLFRAVHNHPVDGASWRNLPLSVFGQTQILISYNADVYYHKLTSTRFTLCKTNLRASKLLTHSHL
jgi:hypothetical protein